MIETVQRSPSRPTLLPSKQRSYHDIIEYLNRSWAIPALTDEALALLDAALGKPSAKINCLAIAGSNGKSLTAHFAEKLLATEGLKVGTLTAPHLLTYNERYSLQGEHISNKLLAEYGSLILDTAEQKDLVVGSHDLLGMIALLHNTEAASDVIIIELDKITHPIARLCPPRALAITRVAVDETTTKHTQLQSVIDQCMHFVKQGTHVVCGDQSKDNLTSLQQACAQRGGMWAMPIRKLAALSYPFEQLHGRCATLAERLCSLYREYFVIDAMSMSGESLLIRPKGCRGRPTLEAKRHAELNPRRTIEHFWKETLSSLPARFQLLEKEKPSLLLDMASNIDALENVLLGIRLLNYQRPLKGLALVIGATREQLNVPEFLKLMRQFFKKTSGHLFICPAGPALPGTQAGTDWNAEVIASELKTLKVKARGCESFTEAFDLAKKSVDERHGLVVITGSAQIVAHYWQEKGIKKL